MIFMQTFIHTLEKSSFVRMTQFCNFDISMYCIFLIQKMVVKVCKEIKEMKLSFETKNNLTIQKICKTLQYILIFLLFFPPHLFIISVGSRISLNIAQQFDLNLLIFFKHYVQYTYFYITFSNEKLDSPQFYILLKYHFLILIYM